MQPDYMEHAQTIIYCIGIFAALMISIVSWLMIRAIGKVDANQTSLFLKYENHENRLSRLEGQHEARTGMKMSCSAEID